MKKLLPIIISIHAFTPSYLSASEREEPSTSTNKSYKKRKKSKQEQEKGSGIGAATLAAIGMIKKGFAGHLPNEDRLDQYGAGAENTDRTKGHTDAITSLHWMNTDEILASGSKDGTIRIWNMNTCLIQHILINNAHVPILSLKFSPNGQYLATGSSDGIVRIISTRDWKLKVTCQAHQGNVNSVDWSHDSALLGSAGDDQYVYIWNVEDIGMQFQSIRVLDKEEGLIRAFLHTAPVNCVRFAHEKDIETQDYLLASGGQDNNVTLWKVSRDRK